MPSTCYRMYVLDCTCRHQFIMTTIGGTLYSFYFTFKVSAYRSWRKNRVRCAHQLSEEPPSLPIILIGKILRQHYATKCSNSDPLTMRFPLSIAIATQGRDFVDHSFARAKSTERSICECAIRLDGFNIFSSLHFFSQKTRVYEKVPKFFVCNLFLQGSTAVRGEGRFVFFYDNSCAHPRSQGYFPQH